MKQTIIKRIQSKIKRILFRDCKTIVIGTPQKVGSTWLYEILTALNYFKVKNIDYSTMLQHRPGESGLDLNNNQETYNYLLSQKHATIIKTHDDPPKKWVPNKNIHIVTIERDPRDVLISAMNYISWLPLEQGGWGKEYAALDDESKFNQLIPKSDWLISKMEAWSEYDLCYKLRYDEMLSSPFKIIKEMLIDFEVPFTDEELTNIIEQNSFSNTKKRALKNNDSKKKNFLRSGKSSQWKDTYTENMKTVFKQNKRWNNLLIKQGYENDNNW